MRLKLAPYGTSAPGGDLNVSYVLSTALMIEIGETASPPLPCELRILVDGIALKSYANHGASRFFVLARAGAKYGLSVVNNRHHDVSTKFFIDSQRLGSWLYNVSPLSTRNITIFHGAGSSFIELKFATPKRSLPVISLLCLKLLFPKCFQLVTLF